MHKLEGDRGLPHVMGSGGLQGALQGVRAQGAEDDAGGPKDARPGECDSVMHGSDRCKIQRGTKAQNRS